MNNTKSTTINMNHVEQISPCGENLWRVYFKSGRNIMTTNDPSLPGCLKLNWLLVDRFPDNSNTGPR